MTKMMIFFAGIDPKETLADACHLKAEPWDQFASLEEVVEVAKGVLNSIVLIPPGAALAPGNYASTWQNNYLSAEIPPELAFRLLLKDEDNSDEDEAELVWKL